MKNILILKFPYSSLFGGGEKHTLTLVDKLSQEDYSFYFLGNCQVLLKELKIRNIPLKNIPAPQEPVSKSAIIRFFLTGPIFKLRFEKKLKNYIQKNNIQTIFCLSLTEKILFTPLFKKLGLNIVWMEHLSIQRWLTKNIFRFWYKKYAKFTKIICASQSIQQELITLGINPKNIQTIYFGLDKISNFQRTNELIEPFTYGTVSRLTTEKGLNLLLKAFKTVADVVKNCQLIIIGDGPEKSNLKKIVSSLRLEEKVFFIGFQKELAKYYQRFNCFVLPSKKRESFGIVLLEALDFQLPVIASKIGGIPEIIKDQQTGLLVTPGSSQELANAMIWVRQNWESALFLGQNGQARVYKDFLLEKTLQEFKNIF